MRKLSRLRLAREMQLVADMLPRLHYRDEDVEPETARRDSSVVPRGTTEPDAFEASRAWDHGGWDDDDEDPLSDTNVMLARHGSKSSAHAVVKPRLVPPPLPFPTGEARRHPPSFAATAAIAEGTAPETVPARHELPPAQQAIAFRDRFASELDDPSSEESPVVHRLPQGWRPPVPALTERAWPTPEEVHQAWLLAQAQAAPPEWVQQPLTAQTSGVQAIAYVTPAPGLSKLRVMSGWLLAMLLGIATTAFWQGDITEHDVRRVAARAQIGAVHISQAIRR